MRYIAFLRAINVGGHNVKMDRLRALFDDLGYANVETVIASGNVIFESLEQNASVLEEQIENHLLDALGYGVETFIRSAAELADIASNRPFPPTLLDAEGNTLHIGFLTNPPDDEAAHRLQALRTPEDDFHVREREFYWLRAGRMSDSTITGKLLEKTLGMPMTMRNVNTIRRIVAKYPAT